MTKKTKKVGPTGRYGARYGVTLRKRVKAIEVKMLKPDYKCPQCKTKAIKRVFNGVWRCKKCGSTFSGGAYFPQTDEGKKSLRNVSRIREKMV